MCKDHVLKWPFAAHRAEACSASVWLITSWLYTRIGYPDGTQVVTAWSPNGYQVLFAWDSLHIQLVSSGVHWVSASAGNLFKFYCGSSTEYQVAVLD